MLWVPDAKKGGDNSVAALFVAAPNETLRLTLGNDRSRGLALADEAAAQTDGAYGQHYHQRDCFHHASLAGMKARRSLEDYGE